MVLLRARVFARGGSHGEFRPRARGRPPASCCATWRSPMRRDPLKNCHCMGYAGGPFVLRLAATGTSRSAAGARDRARKSSLELVATLLASLPSPCAAVVAGA